jgi:hypothetical protein
MSGRGSEENNKKGQMSPWGGIKWRVWLKQFVSAMKSMTL